MPPRINHNSRRNSVTVKLVIFFPSCENVAFITKIVFLEWQLWERTIRSPKFYFLLNRFSFIQLAEYFINEIQAKRHATNLCRQLSSAFSIAFQFFTSKLLLTITSRSFSSKAKMITFQRLKNQCSPVSVVLIDALSQKIHLR